jgi:hypothetical protein
MTCVCILLARTGFSIITYLLAFRKDLLVAFALNQRHICAAATLLQKVVSQAVPESIQCPQCPQTEGNKRWSVRAMEYVARGIP